MNAMFETDTGGVLAMGPIYVYRPPRDCYESAVSAMKAGRAREIEAWLSQLDAWQDDEPPAPPTGRAHY